MKHEWKVNFIGNYCICGHANTCSIWDSLTSLTRYKQTTVLPTASHNTPPLISSATASNSTSNSWTLCRFVRYTTFRDGPQENNSVCSCPVKKVTRTTHSVCALETIWQNTASKHIMQEAKGESRCIWACKILQKKCRVHIPYFLNDRNNFILDLLLLPLLCYGVFHRQIHEDFRLLTFTPHGAFCRMGWRLHDFVRIFGGPESRVLLVH
jgi:hypothetical protein